MNLNVIFAVNNNGFDMMAVALYSVIKNNKKHKLKFHIFHKDISIANISRLEKFKKSASNVNIIIHNVGEERFENLKVNNVNVTVEAYFRYLAPELLPDEDRALYIDFDMLCLADLKDLYSINLEDKCIGAVADRVVERSPTFKGFKSGIGFKASERYANSGLLLLNLAALRQESLMETFWHNVKNKHRIIPKELNFFADQTVMNLTFKHKIKFLDPKFNVFTTTLAETKERDPALVHFTGAYKPLTFRNEYTIPYDELYYSYYNECIAIVGDDKGSLVKTILKKQASVINNQFSELTAKEDMIRRYEAHIQDIESRLHAQDRHIKSLDQVLNTQRLELDNPVRMQKRAIRTALRKMKSKIGVLFG
jgi:lipopolysaccharide biosynthesis glycosyltransferase